MIFLHNKDGYFEYNAASWSFDCCQCLNLLSVAGGCHNMLSINSFYLFKIYMNYIPVEGNIFKVKILGLN